MGRTLTVYSDQVGTEAKWVSEIQGVLPPLAGLRIFRSGEKAELGDLVLLDGEMSDLEKVIAGLDRKGRAIILVVGSGEDKLPNDRSWMKLLESSLVDDVVGYPFRDVELISKFRYFEQLMQWNEVFALSSSVSEVLKRFEEDLQLAERIQGAKYPKKFSHVKGYRVVSRYLAGLASGGDYFDVAESRDQSHLSLLLSQASSYGLSSAVLTVLMRVMLKLSSDHLEEAGAPYRIIKQIYEDLLMTLGPKDHLSICYGIISRYNQTFRFLNLGNGAILHAYPNEKFTELPKQPNPISRGLALSSDMEGSLELRSGSRLVLVSHGLIESVGGASEIQSILNAQEDPDVLKTLNEFIFRVKSKLAADDMPARDCSAVLVESESPTLQMIRKS